MAKTFQDLLNEGQAKVLGIVSIVPMDDWNADTQYQKLNLVRHNGATYLAKGGNKNVEPGAAADWQNSWMLVYLDGILSPDGTYPNLTAGRVMHALAWGNKNYDGSSAQTITAADLGLADVYKPQGSIAYSALPATPSADNYGYVWNITDDFTTDSRFIEGAGKSYSAGTNVGVIEQDSAYYYDIFGAFIDLSNYATVEALNSEITRAKAAEQANATAASNAQSTANSKYTKPSSGIPKSDLAQSVQDSLDKANSALQSAPVTSVNGETGAVSLSASDVGAATSAQGTKADQAATDIANIKEGTTVVGKAGTANSLTAVQIPNNADLNDYVGSEYWGKVFYATGEQVISNSPVPASYVFHLEVLRLSGNTVQVITAGSSSNNSLASTRYFRYVSSNLSYGNWEEIVTSDGSYPTLGAGYLAKNAKIVAASDTVGWWKIGTLNVQDLGSPSRSSSTIFLVNGLYPHNNPSGLLELKGRIQSGSINAAAVTLKILSGNLSSNDHCIAIDGDIITLYGHLDGQYMSKIYTILQDSSEGAAQINANLFTFDAEFYGTSAPSGAVYAVNRNQADYNSAGAALVDVASAQQISGAKTFTGNNIVKASFSRTAGAGNFKYFDYLDSNNNRMGVIGVSAISNNYYGTYMQAGNEGALGIYSNGSDVYTSAPTPDASDDSTKIATTEWVRDYFNVSNNRSDLDAVFSATFTGTSGIRSLGESYYNHPFFAIKWTKTNSSSEVYTNTLFIPTDMITQGNTSTYFSLTDTEDYLNWWFNSSSSFQFECSKNTQLTIYFYDFNF